MKTTFVKSILSVALIAGMGTLSSCLSKGDDTLLLTDGQEAPEAPTNPLGIPDDDQASEAPSIGEPTMNVPGTNITSASQDGYVYMNLTMNGIWNEDAGSWLNLAGTGKPDQNVWLTIDDKPKGIDVYNNSEGGDVTIMTDVVFLIDNSGSMSEEADEVANSIIDWVNALEASGLSLRVGCVGYGDSYHAIDGALNMTTSTEMKNYLDRGYGTNRTHGYGGSDADALRALAEGGNYENGSYNECGMVALHFASDNFQFRGGANRIYINFTDEPNQNYGVDRWSVEWLNPQYNNWPSALGTVHSVFSERKDYWSYNSYNEQPWLMSDYTGGTTIFTDRYFTDVKLSDLPVTGAIANSYVIRFGNVDDLFDGQEHEVKITILSRDGKVRAEKVFKTIFEAPQE